MKGELEVISIEKDEELSAKTEQCVNELQDLRQKRIT